MSSYAEKKAKRNAAASERRHCVKFERQPSRIAFDPVSTSFVVTWVKCSASMEERLMACKDPLSWLPSISALATLFDRGCVPPNQTVYIAKSIGRAWKAGDRFGLDTDEAKKAAELVADLASMCVDAKSPSVSRDVGHALRHLLDEMAAVRFLNASDEDFSEDGVLPSLTKALDECLWTDEFISWPPVSKRRRFLFCLNRHERTEVAYTLVSLLFDTGACPLLSLTDRRVLRMETIGKSGLDANFDRAAVTEFFRLALSSMRNIKRSGGCRLGKLTFRQYLDSLSGMSGEDCSESMRKLSSPEDKNKETNETH